jgi:hypothetical protein
MDIDGDILRASNDGSNKEPGDENENEQCSESENEMNGDVSGCASNYSNSNAM